MSNTIFILGWGFLEESFPAELRNKFYKNITFIDIRSLFDHSNRPNFKIIENLITDDTIIIGWSLGSLVALELCTRLKNNKLTEKISKLILVSATSSFLGTDKDLTKEDNLLNLEQSIKEGGAKKDKALKNFYWSLLSETEIYKIEKNLYLKNFTETANQIKTHQLINALEYLRETNLTEELRELEINTNLVHGAKDLLIPKEHMSNLNYLIPHSYSVLMDNSGHLIPLLNPEEFMNLIMDVSPERSS